jgi:hypothetical protein
VYAAPVLFLFPFSRSTKRRFRIAGYLIVAVAAIASLFASFAAKYRNLPISK